jgi:DNA-binding HxlR family transcriptional regulator
MELKDSKRFNELKRSIPDISEKVLIDKLKVLEGAGFVDRKDFKEIPPRVEYSLTKNGLQVFDLIPELIKIGKKIK